MRDYGNIEVKLLIEGVDVPCISLSRNRVQGSPATLNANVFSSPKLRHILPNSSVMAFVYSDAVGEYELFFSGRLVGKGISEGAQSNSMSISAMGFSSVLTEMPTMIYQTGEDYSYQNSVGTKFFYGQNPGAQFSNEIVATLYENTKNSLETAIGDAAKYYIDMAGRLSPMQKKVNLMTRIRRSMAFESNGQLATIVGQELMQKIARALQGLPASASVWDVIGYMLGFGKLNLVELQDAVQLDNGNASWANSLIKPVMTFMRPPMCNTILMKEEGNAAFTLQDMGASGETRFAVMNSSYNFLANAVTGYSAFAPNDVSGLTRTLIDERLAAVRNGDSSESLNGAYQNKSLDLLYSEEELLRCQVVPMAQRSPLEGVASDEQRAWMDSLATYSYDNSKYSRRAVNISGLTLSRNLAVGLPAAMITRLGEKITGVIHSVSDTIDFQQGSAQSNVVLASPIYSDEFEEIEGFSLSVAESSLKHFDDKYKPENINSQVYAKYGMEDRAPMTSKSAPTTVAQYMADLQSVYASLTSYEQYAAAFTRRIYTLAEMEVAFLGSGSAKKNWGYEATLTAADKASDDYNGPPFLVERQALAREYRNDVFANNIELSGVTLAVAES